jgi:hypothetical protein
MPLHVSNTCAHHHEVKIALHCLWYHQTETSEWSKITKTQFYKYEQIVVNFWTPIMSTWCSKHVEAWNKLTVKQKILCIKFVNYWDKYTEMHGQQNVKK